MILNLDPKFKPIYGESIAFESFTFNGGEPHIRIGEITNPESVTVTHRLNSFNDLGLLCIAVDALKRMKVKEIQLFIPYFPGARQDRVMVEGESLTIKVYADIINKLGANQVSIYDPHSDVTPALINNCKVISNHLFVKQLLPKLPSDVILISPDSGASKRIYSLAKSLKIKQVLECGKKRDVATGSLSGFKVPTDNINQRSCLIVDDICDGGGTFLGLGKELKNKNAGDLYLAVSHGIFSNGLAELSKLYKQVFTTDSVKAIDSSSVHQIDLKNILNHEV